MCTYKDFSKIIYKLKGKNFCIDNLTCSISNESIIKKSFKIKLKIDPCYLMKSIKNKLEIKHMVNAHLKDGLALTKFIFWIKNINKKKITEIEAKNKLEKFRKLNKDYLFPSFDTIAGTGSNGAIIHYRVNKKSNKIIKKMIFFYVTLEDNIILEQLMLQEQFVSLNQKQSIKNIFTNVLKGHIAVAQTDLNKIYTGKKIDNRARKVS